MHPDVTDPNCFLWENKSTQSLRRTIKKTRFALSYVCEHEGTREKEEEEKKKVNNKHESDVGGGEIFFWPVSLYSLEHLKNPWMKERKGKQRHALLIVSVICPYKWLFLDPFFFLLIFFCWCYSVRSIHEITRIFSKWYNRIYIFVINSKN